MSGYVIPRDVLAKVFGNPRAELAFERMQATVGTTELAVAANVEATQRLEDAAFITLSSNATLPNEYVLTLGTGLKFDTVPGQVTIKLTDNVPLVDGGFRVKFVTAGDTMVALPPSGTLVNEEWVISQITAQVGAVYLPQPEADLLYAPIGVSGTVTSVSGAGTVSGLTLTGTVTSAGNLTLGGVLTVLPADFGSQGSNRFIAAPTGAAGVPTFRKIALLDLPTQATNTFLGNVSGVNAAPLALTAAQGRTLLNVHPIGTTGWAAYVNTAAAQVLVANTKVALVNNSGTTILVEHPTDVVSLYDGTVITGRDGDAIGIGIELTFTPSSGVASNLYACIDIGGAVGEIYPVDFGILKGSGIAHRLSYTALAYTGATWQTNGGTVRIEADGPGSVTGVRYVIHRLHKA